MDELKIEKGVPIPPARVGRKPNGPSKYMFDRFEVGDSVYFHPEHGDLHKVQSCAAWWGKRHKVKFSLRKLKDGGFRVWRIA